MEEISGPLKKLNISGICPEVTRLIIVVSTSKVIDSLQLTKEK